MKLKISILLLIAAIAGASITVVVIRKQRQVQAVQENQWPVAMSNYSKTFKLNTSPPLWPASKGVTNGNTN
jgi:hypothetical protein